MNDLETYDVVIIGAGPSGALASSLLVQKGWKVLVLEQQQFPRFSIGESLLPQCMTYLADANLVDVVDEQADSLGFQFKNGAAFYRKGEYTTIDFTEKYTRGPDTTYQVKRADFDKLIADNAQKQGVEIRYQQRVIDFSDETSCAILHVQADDQQSYKIKARFVLDASGFGRVLPRLLNLDRPSSFPERSAYFGHFKDNITDDSYDRNKILITVHPDHKDIWYWLIPFSDGTSSIGVVAEPKHFKESNSDDVLNHFIHQEPYLTALLANRELLTKTRSITGYSADVETLHGKHFALLGNAGEFLDPVFSSGVTIALKSAHLIAPLLDKYLKGEVVDFEASYAEPLKVGVNCFKTFVNGWYDTRLQDVIFYEGQNIQIRQMISAILAGYAWDTTNPYVTQSERRLTVLAQLCQN